MARSELKIYTGVAALMVIFTVVLLSIQGCALIEPSRADLMKACLTSPEVQKRASELGMTAEDLCRELLRESPDAAPSMNGCSSGSCPMPTK